MRRRVPSLLVALADRRSRTPPRRATRSRASTCPRRTVRSARPCRRHGGEDVDAVAGVALTASTVAPGATAATSSRGKHFRGIGFGERDHRLGAALPGQGEHAFDPAEIEVGVGPRRSPPCRHWPRGAGPPTSRTPRSGRCAAPGEQVGDGNLVAVRVERHPVAGAERVLARERADDAGGRRDIASPRSMRITRPGSRPSAG